MVDAPINVDDTTQLKLAEEEIDLMVETASKTAGNLPGVLKELVKANKEHKQDYKDLLRDFLENALHLNDYTWETPDRVYTSHGMFLPGPKYEEELPQIVFGIDTSGSIGTREKITYANEISGVLDEFPCTIKAIYCDTGVRHTQDLCSDDLPIKLEIRGGGGTRFSPVFKYIKEHNLDPKAILFFTDLCTNDYGEDPEVPVLWMNTDRRRDKDKMPFGEIIALELEK